MPKFSIIIPVYNVAPYLRECLDSVLAQTFTDWEAICVDDGSTDGSGAILDEYREKVEKLDGGGRRMVVIHQANAGVSAARNAALDVAKGEYVCFVDGDDAIHADMLRVVYDSFLIHPDADSFMFNGFYMQENPPQVWLPLPRATTLRVSSVRNSETYHFARCTAWTTVYRTEKIRQLGLRFSAQYKMSEDTLFALHYYWGTARWIIAPEKLYFYRQRVGSAALSKATLKIASDWLDVENQMADMLSSHRAEWTNEGMMSFWTWNRQMIWNTYRSLFFRLSNADMRKCMGLWLSLQRKYTSLAADGSLTGLYRRFVVVILCMLPLPFLCRVLVRGERLLRKCLRRK